MSSITTPLRSLLKSDIHFIWEPEQQSVLAKVKEVLSSAPVLHYFNPIVVSTIQADASQSGLGACLLQKGKPIAYASKSLSPSECKLKRNYWPLYLPATNSISTFTDFSPR